MFRLLPSSTRTYKLFPYTTLLRSLAGDAGHRPASAIGRTSYVPSQLLVCGGVEPRGRTPDSGPHHLQRAADSVPDGRRRSEKHTSELQSLMLMSYAVFSLK